MQTIHILSGGPDLWISADSKKWKFEDHPYCGPVVVDKVGDPVQDQPPDNSPFWSAVTLWYAQGKRTRPPLLGETWCIWDKPTMAKMRHLGGNQYEFITDGQAQAIRTQEPTNG